MPNEDDVKALADIFMSQDVQVIAIKTPKGTFVTGHELCRASAEALALAALEYCERRDKKPAKIGAAMTDEQLTEIEARAAEVETGPRIAADREELLRLLAKDVSMLTAEVRRLEEETAVWYNGCRGSRRELESAKAYNTILCNQNENLRAQLARIREKAGPINNARKYGDRFGVKDIIALADAIQEEAS